MFSYRAVAETTSRWLDRVTATIVEVIGCFRQKRAFQLVEQEDGSFVLQGAPQGGPTGLPAKPIRIVAGQIEETVSVQLAALLRGAQVELVLRPKHFMVRLIELPRRASEFLDGIVRAQIDRLTPWSIGEAAYGWHPSADAGTDRMAVMVAATARAVIAPFISAIEGLGVDQIVVKASVEEPDSGPIKIFEHKIKQAADLRRYRRILAGALATAGAVCGLSVAVNGIAGSVIKSQRDDIMLQIGERRATLELGREKATAAVLELQQRKYKAPSSVIVLEALSRILPDDTYLTELRILGDKVQIIGLTHDAPSLIKLIEKNSHFTKAVFFAPTTRSTAESGEHFSIETHVEPVYTADK